MKRYRPLNYDFDTRAHILRTAINPDWEPVVRETWENNRTGVIAGIAHEFGEHNLEQKLRDFSDCGDVPLSVISFHNLAFRQIRDSFVAGAYYPALTGACALGERILNHLILGLRDQFKATPEYKKVHRKDSFDDWSTAVSVLSGWRVLRPEVTTAFDRLRELRHRSIHFDPSTVVEARERAVAALALLLDIVHRQFGAFGDHPWFCSVPGVVFIKKSFEANPFIRLVYLPNCVLVGPNHRLRNRPGASGFIVDDDIPYEEREISDDEFLRLYEESLGQPA